MSGAISKELQELSECLTPKERKAILGEDDSRMSRPLKAVLPRGMKNMEVKFPEFTGIDLPNPRLPAKYSDSELVFVFENEAAAQSLFDMAVFEMGLMPGEIILHKDDETGRCAVSIMPLVYVTHPEVVYAILMTYHRHAQVQDDLSVAEDVALDLEAMITGTSLKVHGPKKGITRTRIFFSSRRGVEEASITGKRLCRFDEEKFRAVKKMTAIFRRGARSCMEGKSKPSSSKGMMAWHRG